MNTEAGIEKRVSLFAASFPYPKTPNFQTKALRRQVALRPRMALIPIILLALLAVSNVRAAIQEWMQIGAVSILVPEPGLPKPVANVYALDELNGESTLEAAREFTGFELGLPTYPQNLGEPNRVFVQEVNPEQFFVILVWGRLEKPDMAFYIIEPGVYITKGAPETLEEVEVNGSAASWVLGGHLLRVQGFHQYGVLVEAPTLVWEGEAGFTYRLEAPYAVDEMIRIAESIG